MMSLLSRQNVLAFSVAIALSAALTACGGGGGGNGNVRATPSPAPAPAPAPPPPAPTPTSGPAPVTLTGSPAPLSTPAVPGYNQWDAQLGPINATQAWASGNNAGAYQGQGVKVGIIDTGVQDTNPALVGRISWFADYVDPGNTIPQDGAGHGTIIAQIIGGVANLPNIDFPYPGSANPYFFGGVAPQSSLYVARTGDNSGNFNLNLEPQALAGLTAQGVKLINNSYGSTTQITGVTSSNSIITQEYGFFSQIPSNGQLMVWAAGNNGMSQPSIESGLPYYEPSLQNNWLAVVNVALNSNGQVTGLDTTATSNACGVAAAWCLAAPGYAYFAPVTNTQFATGAADGTSDSAAVVTGVAALVWQRFPFFTATNVQQTLLGTATNLGNPAFYGYGLVNAAAAVNGPGELNWGAFSVTIPNGGNAFFSNNMTGSGSIALSGEGDLSLTGENNIGGVTVNGGFLFLEGTNTFSNPVGATVNGGTLVVVTAVNSNVTINQAGILTGVAGSVINGNVINGGEINTVNGSYKINGNYTAMGTQSTAGPNINTQIQLGSSLDISGTATLNKSLLVVDIPAGYTPQSEELLLTANNGVLGTFGSLQVNGSVYYTGGSLSYSTTQVDVSLNQTSVTAVAEASMPPVATTQQTAQHIQTALMQTNQWAPADSSAHQIFLNAASDFLHVASIAQAAISINSLSGQLLASSQGLTFEQAGIVNRTVADRLGDLGNGDSQQGAWFQGTGASGDIARSGYATGSYNGGGSVAGYDAKVADNFTMGVGLDWNRLGSSFSMQGGNSSSRSTGAILYAKYADGSAYITGRLGEDWIHSDTSRTGVLGTTAAPITSTRNDTMTSAYLEAGFDAKSDAWTTTPFASAGDEHLDRGAIAEQGAGGFGIAAPSDDFNQSYAQLGARLAYRWNWSTGQITLKGFALYQRILGGQDIGFTAAYAGVPNATFQLDGVNSPRNSGWIGAGLNAAMSNHWSWFANLDGQVAGGGTKATVFSAGARYSF